MSQCKDLIPWTPPPRVGRPSKYKPELVAEICERLGKGEPLAKICRDDHMPYDGTVRDWMARDASISHAIARAREAGEDWLAAECLQIADTPQVGVIVRDSPEGRTVTTEDMLGHRKLQIDTRLKLLSKWNPKKYGERLDLNHKGDVVMHITARRMILPDESGSPEEGNTP